METHIDNPSHLEDNQGTLPRGESTLYQSWLPLHMTHRLSVLIGSLR